jgi:entericidin B
MTARNALFVALAVLGLSACNTIGGLGEDVEAGGEAITDASNDVEQEIE